MQLRIPTIVERTTLQLLERYYLSLVEKKLSDVLAPMKANRAEAIDITIVG